jgi:hypothetical protein
MSLLFLALAVTLGAPPDGGVVAVSQSAIASPRSAADLRTAVHAALRQWARPTDSSADRAARDLLALYREVAAHPTLAGESRKELALQLRSRLTALAQQISARKAKSVAVPQGNPPVLGQVAGPAVGRAPGAAGGTDAGYVGDDLAEVIRRTIAPSTWDVNGGQGSIMFWRQGNALVVRQTQEIHAEIENLVGALEKAGK